jgi:hypothetical protein
MRRTTSPRDEKNFVVVMAQVAMQGRALAGYRYFDLVQQGRWFAAGEI